MSQNENSYTRWHDQDVIVAKCISLLENIKDSIKRQTATFLMDEIISKPPYNNMLPEEIYNLALSETRKRRWYDMDEVLRLFVEMLRHCPPEARKEVAIKAINFIESQTVDNSKSIALESPDELPSITKYYQDKDI